MLCVGRCIISIICVYVYMNTCSRVDQTETQIELHKIQFWILYKFGNKKINQLPNNTHTVNYIRIY